MKRILCLLLGHQWYWIYSKFEAVCHRCHKRIKAEPESFYQYGDDTVNLELK